MTVGYAFVVGDLLHVGHLNFLEQCKQYCSYLIVGVYSDELTMTYKRRPVIPFEERIRLVGALRVVDEVRRVDNKSCVPMLKQLAQEGVKVDFLFHGDDWNPEKDVDFKESKQFIEKIGGKLVQPPYTKGISTTEITNRLLQRIKEILDKAWNFG